MKPLKYVLMLLALCEVFFLQCEENTNLHINNEPRVVVSGGKYGYIDDEGKFVIPAMFFWSEGFYNGLADTYICGRMVKIDRTLNVYSMKKAGVGELIPWKEGSKTGFVDSHGNFKIPPSFDEVLPFAEGLAAAKARGKWGFVDTSGKWVISPQFDEAYYFDDGVANVSINDEQAIINKDGKVIYRGSGFLTKAGNNRIPVFAGDKYGFIDREGRVAIPFAYDSVLGFSEGLSAVEKAGKWGYIDTQGNLVIPFDFDFADFFALGLAPVRSGSDSGFIDTRGKYVFHLPFESSSGFSFSEPARFWTKDNQFGYVTRSGHVIWGPTREMPDHYPILGFSKDDEKISCQGIPDHVRRKVELLPKNQ